MTLALRELSLLLLEEPLRAECAGTGIEQGFEHGALLPGEVDLSSVAGDGTGERVELDPGRSERAAAGAGLAAGEASAFLCPRVFAGEGEASGLAAGAGEVSAFLRPRVFAGEAEASGLVAGEASAFFLRTFFAGEADASGLALGEIGLCAPTRETPARIIITTSRARFVVMKRS